MKSTFVCKVSSLYVVKKKIIICDEKKKIRKTNLQPPKVNRKKSIKLNHPLFSKKIKEKRIQTSSTLHNKLCVGVCASVKCGPVFAFGNWRYKYIILIEFRTYMLSCLFVVWKDFLIFCFFFFKSQFQIEVRYLVVSDVSSCSSLF